MSKQSSTGLTRNLGLLGLAATGICSMLGAAINIIPFTLLRSVPEAGPYVLPSYMFAALPALLAAFCYAILASAMPRAGGSYVYASRSLNPYLGFVASFSQWFGLSIAIGVISYVIVFPFLFDVVAAMGFTELAASLEFGPARLYLPIIFLWTFVAINIRGLQLYEKTLIPLMFLMFALGAIVIVAGFAYDHQDFSAALMAKEGRTIATDAGGTFSFSAMLAAAAILFSSFIGFDSIAQAGGEAKNPGKALPLAIGIAVVGVGSFYMLFTAAMYHAIPWQFVAEEAARQDIAAPGLLAYLLPPGLTIAIAAGAVIALINDLPAMLLAVSRLMFAWAEDGIFPKKFAEVHPKRHTPHYAIIGSGLMATVSIIGCHEAGDFFLGVDILVTSMLVNFLLMCLSVLMLPRRNPTLAAEIKVFTNRAIQIPLATLGTILLTTFLVIHVVKDFNAEKAAWYFHSTPVWILVMAVASGIYLWEMKKLRESEVDVEKLYSTLPPE